MTDPPTHATPAGGGPTLEQLLAGVWEAVHASGTAACPVCRGRMRPAAAAGAAGCEGCGAVVL